MAFLPCPSCRRHVRDLDDACPFCGHARSAASVKQARPRTRLPRGSMFAFASVAVALGCSSESVTSNPPAPVVDSAVADTGAADTAVKMDSGSNDTGSATDSGTVDTATSDTASADSATDTRAEEDSAATDTGLADDGGAAPLYGLPPPM